MVYGNQSSDICYSSAVHVCENCGQACDELIDLPGWNFKACEACAEEAAREDARDIRTDFVYPPIPSRNFDWAAWLDGHEEGPVGYGRTEAEAVRNLREQMEEEAA